MDELSLFRGASAELHRRSRPQLFARADLVFTGGHEPLRGQARASSQRSRLPVHASISTHFAQARVARAGSAGPGRHRRIRGSASSASSTSAWTSISSAGWPTLRPDWQFVMIGPVVKIDPAILPRRAEHPLARRQDLRRAAALSRRLGRRAHALRAQRIDPLHQPDQDAGIPRRRRAGGLDADRRRGAPYGEKGLVEIARDRRGDRRQGRGDPVAAERTPGSRRSTAHLATRSWDKTWAAMHALMQERWRHRTRRPATLPVYAADAGGVGSRCSTG